jgi:hypothetical protein
MPDDTKNSLDRSSESDALRLTLDAEQVELRHLVSAASTFAALVQEVSRTITRGEGSVIWTVALEPGSVAIPIRPQTEPTIKAELLRAIPEGVSLLEQGAQRPAHFTNQALLQAQSLANLSSKEMPIRVRDGRESVTLTKQLVANVEVLTRERQPRIGTVEGRLEEADVHGRPTFKVLERLSGDKVQCRAREEVTIDELGAALGKRVAVRGRIRESKAGHKITIDVKQLRVFPDEETLPTADDVRGILKPAS